MEVLFFCATTPDYGGWIIFPRQIEHNHGHKASPVFDHIIHVRSGSGNCQYVAANIPSKTYVHHTPRIFLAERTGQ